MHFLATMEPSPGPALITTSTLPLSCSGWNCITETLIAMKTLAALTLTLLALHLPLCAEITGREIIEKQQTLHQVPMEQTRFQMILVDKKGRERMWVLTVDSKPAEQGLERIRLQFEEPAEIRGVTLFILEQENGQEDAQWLYLPARKSSKRIASSAKKTAFMGTNLAFEDLRPENLDTHNYTVVGEAAFEGSDCWLIEAFPATGKEKKESGYSKRILWVRKDIFFTVQVHYFDRRGHHTKTLSNRSLTQIGEKSWRSDHSITTNVGRNTATIMEVEERSLNPQFTDTHFDPETLSR
jgi:hypothetical protein